MKYTIITTYLLFFFIGASAQGLSKQYYNHVQQADSLYNARDYLHAAQKYADAFSSNDAKFLLKDKYNEACSWALAGMKDSSFSCLSEIQDYIDLDLNHVSTDSDLISLHADARWDKFIEILKQRKQYFEANLNKPLVAILDTIEKDDQYYRLQVDSIQQKYGWGSKEVLAQWELISKKDSINLVKVKKILDTYGWLGIKEVGATGNVTLFLVIQHSDLATQEKYLPMMRDAVKKGNAQPHSLALLEDRVAIREGRKQIYGSQIIQDQETHRYYVSPLEDPDNVDKRRAAVGLPPIAEYVKQWNIKWDVEAYKKELPTIEKIEAKNK